VRALHDAKRAFFMDNCIMDKPPFSFKYTKSVNQLLASLKVSLSLTTYNAGKLIFISPQANGKLMQLPRSFIKPMGIAVDMENQRLAMATKDEIILFKNSSELAWHYPKKPSTYDVMFLPRVIYKTSFLDIHDVEFGKDGIYAVNTLFSCIAKIDGEFNFTPYWNPSFVTEMLPEDRCHLNGMVMVDGLPRYATAFNQGNTHRSWKTDITKTGVLIDTVSNEIICDDLAMPHSPRLINGKMYLLLSATGELVSVDLSNGQKTVITNLNGFVRGMSYYNGYLFIGLSKIRESSSTFKELKIAEKAKEAGIAIIHLETGNVVGKIIYESSVDEIYDVRVVPNALRPNILNTENPEAGKGVSIPDSTFWGKVNE